jgi:hypothetical protein
MAAIQRRQDSEPGHLSQGVRTGRDGATNRKDVLTGKDQFEMQN